MARKFATMVIKGRMVILILTAIFTVFFAYKAKDVTLKQDLSDIIPPHHPYTQVDKKFFETFGGSNLVAIGMKVKSGDITDYVNLGKVFRITEDLDAIRDIVTYRIVSIASPKMRLTEFTVDPRFPDTPTIENTGYYTVVQDILRDKDEAKRLMFRKTGIMLNPNVFGTFVSKDMKGTVILCDFWGDKHYREIYAGLKKIVDREKDDNTSFYLGGRPILLGYLDQYLGQMLFLFLIASGVILLLLLVMFRGFRGIVLPFVAGVITIIWVMGIVALLDIRMDMMSITVPFLIFAILAGHSVQILSRYYEEVARVQDNKEACIATIEGLLVPGLAAIITDMLGFTVLYVFPFRILQSMALMGTFGIAFTFIFIIMLLPCILSVLPVPSRKEWERVGKPGATVRMIGDRMRAVIGRRARYVVFGSALVVMLIFAYGSRNMVVGDAQEGSPYFFQDAKYNQDEYVLNHEFLGTNPIYILFDAKQLFGLNSAKIAKYVDGLSERLRKMEEVRYVNSYVDLVKGMNFYWFALDPAQFRVPDTDNEIGLYLYSYIQAVEPEVTKPLFDPEQRWGNIQVIIRDHQTATIDKVINFIKHDVETIGKPAVGDSCDILVAGGIIANFASIIDEIRNRNIFTLVIITIIDVICCAFAFRSIVLALLVLFPLAMGVFVTNGIMGYFNIGLFLYTVPIASLGMGLGVDYSIYVVCRWADEYRRTGDRDRAFEIMSHGSGKAVMFTALAVVLGGFSLMFSELRFQVIMGGFLGAVIFIDMLGALFGLPAVFAVCKVKQFSKNREAQ